MPCYSPLQAYKTKSGDVVFSELKRHDIDYQFNLPCGQCIGCRLERSRQWAVRCMHEASLYKNNSFITLTYEDAKLPERNSLYYPHFQLFLKRLRKHAGPTRVRFYMCGEYGEQTNRPHYHACLFNWDWEDKRYWRTTATGEKSYRSDALEKLWPHGNAETGSVTFESAAYVARYIMKKVTGKNAEEHYNGREPEFNEMSLKPGIGANWFELWKKDVYPHDYVIVRGVKAKPPKYYDQMLKRIDPILLDTIKENRELEGYKHHQDNTPERLAVKEIVATAKVNQLKRTEI